MIFQNISLSPLLSSISQKTLLKAVAGSTLLCSHANSEKRPRHHRRRKNHHRAARPPAVPRYRKCGSPSATKRHHTTPLAAKTYGVQPRLTTLSTNSLPRCQFKRIHFEPYSLLLGNWLPRDSSPILASQPATLFSSPNPPDPVDATTKWY